MRPDFRYAVNYELTACGTVGFRGGSVELRTDGVADAFETDIALHTAVAGAHRVFLRRDGGLSVVVRGGTFVAHGDAAYGEWGAGGAVGVLRSDRCDPLPACL